MKTVRLRLGQRSYDICIGGGIIDKLHPLLKLWGADTPLFVVTNKKINSLHGGKLKKVLERTSKKILSYEVPDSERAKSFPVYIRTIRALARFAKKRKPVVFAFGGGVIGDLAGFLASAYRRGVPYVQIPTTLLSQVDSAIGGKVAIDIREAKNIVGNFYQPKMVVCDTQFLRTLPEKELRNGLVEIVKYGIIKDRGLFVFLEGNIKKVLRLDEGATEYVIFKSCSIKARVVEKDEFDTKDLRAILNFGHTIGHAIEAATRYSKSVTHGRAIAAGMIMASRIALAMGTVKKTDYEKICSLVKKVMPKARIKHLKSGDILNALSYDKKFIAGTNRFILPKKIGRVEIVSDIPGTLIRKVIESCIGGG
ncbi:MAG: 3-dehydroquinate synthase [Candidatus Omnitrophota bacterium]